MKRNFTDRFVRSLKAAPPGKRVEHWDTKVPCFGIRVTDRGHKTYVLYLRWPGSRTASRREIGNADRLSLVAARRRARQWLEQVELGVDPGAEERRALAEARSRAEREKESTFAKAAEAWFVHIRPQRKSAEVVAAVRREFLPVFGSRPLASITDEDIAALVDAKREMGHAAQARNLLGYAKRMFKWVVAIQNRRRYGLLTSPAALLLAKDIIGPRIKRERLLGDGELRAVWEAAEKTPYPYGPIVRLLMLTGQRRSEVGDATWSEFDLDKRLWTIAAERMKMKKAHVVPLSDAMIRLLEGLPRFADGDHLFTNTSGRRPVDGYSQAKKRLDALLPPMDKWVIHDIRRAVRSGLSRLKDIDHAIDETVRERMIAHVPKGEVGTYDLYDYLKEKRRGFELWAEMLDGIVHPPDNVLAYKKRRDSKQRI
jgi:integrase